MTTWARLGFWAFSAALLASACGCDGQPSTSTTSSGGAAGEGGGGGQGGQGGEGGGGEAYGTSAAGVCFAEKCASEINTCKADPECPAFLSCLDACPVDATGDADPACVALCPTGMGSQSMMAAAAVDDCRTNGAGAVCLACTSPQPEYTSPVLNQTCPDPSMETNVCFKCEDEKCCDTYVACKNNPECDALVKNCLALCAAGDLSCEKDCVAQHPAGADDLGARFACMRVRCFAEQLMCDRCLREPAEVCLYDTCGDAYAAYLSGPNGYAHEACIHACPVDDMACDQVCHADYPDAYMRFGALADCFATQCNL
jgi:hypothetical protein